MRLHRAGEGASFTGLKPAGLDVGPIIPIADIAALEEALVAAVRGQLAERFRHLGHVRAGAQSGIDGAPSYVQAVLGLQVWAQGLYQATRAPGHLRGHTHD